MLENDYIVKYICKLYNIDLSEYKTINENGEYVELDAFDKRFSLDRTYNIDFGNYRRRIRFVKYDNKNITVFRTTIRISHILSNKLDIGNRVYLKEIEMKIPIKEIIINLDRDQKIKKLCSKLEIK
jgi:hypothetical protein